MQCSRPLRRPRLDRRRQWHPRGRHRGARRGLRRTGGVGGHPASRARRDPAVGLREDHRTRRGHRDPNDAGNGQGAAREPGRIAGRLAPRPAGTGRVLFNKQAGGPCHAITPWNFPLAMGTRKIGPAFAAGCTMIVKPAQETPLTMLLLAKLIDEAGLPKGVLSVLPTNSPGPVTEALINDGRLRKLTFTGSTGVGKALVKQSADKLLRTSMELGGNAPFVVFDDADVDAAVDGAILAKMRNGGEACTAANRFHVANSVREEFTE